jgi:hypothetical protein
VPVSVPDPWKFPTAWNQVVFLAGKGRFALQGEVTVDAKPGSARIDEQTVPGVNGTFRVMNGYSDASASVQIQFWEYKHFEVFQSLVNTMNAQGRAAPTVVSVLHPNLTLAGMKQCFVHDLEIGDFTNDDGITVKFSLTEELTLTDKNKLDALRKKVKAADSGGAGANDGALNGGTGGNGGTTGKGSKAKKNPPSKDKPQGFLPGPLGAAQRGFGDGSNAARKVTGR